MFEFLEVENTEHKEQLHYQEIIKEIPDNQRLSLSDLQIIKPSAAVLKLISKKILLKHSLIPLFTLLPGNKPVLPKHLKREYWGFIEGKKSVTLYVAMLEPFNQHVLNIIRSITQYSVVSIPLHNNAVNLFFNGIYEQTVNNKSMVIEKTTSQSEDVIELIKQNFLYIMFFICLIVGLVAIKPYIEM